jgi:hypothetical protein
LIDLAQQRPPFHVAAGIPGKIVEMFLHRLEADLGGRASLLVAIGVNAEGYKLSSRSHRRSLAKSGER